MQGILKNKREERERNKKSSSAEIKRTAGCASGRENEYFHAEKGDHARVWPLFWEKRGRGTVRH